MLLHVYPDGETLNTLVHYTFTNWLSHREPGVCQ